MDETNGNGRSSTRETRTLCESLSGLWNTGAIYSWRLLWSRHVYRSCHFEVEERYAILGLNTSTAPVLATTPSSSNAGTANTVPSLQRQLSGDPAASYSSIYSTERRGQGNPI
jgi:hypothetical protein